MKKKSNYSKKKKKDFLVVFFSYRLTLIWRKRKDFRYSITTSLREGKVIKGVELHGVKNAAQIQVSSGR